MCAIKCNHDPSTDNTERLASSIMKQVQFQLRHSAEVRALLGEGVHLEPGLLGMSFDPWMKAEDRR